eukprot:250592-Rhodomonas_salina.2
MPSGTSKVPVQALALPIATHHVSIVPIAMNHVRTVPINTASVPLSANYRISTGLILRVQRSWRPDWYKKRRSLPGLVEVVRVGVYA